MRFTLNIRGDNAAFEEDPRGELSRLLEEVAEEVLDGIVWTDGKRTLRDVNGNAVGSVTLTGMEPR